MGYIIGGQKRTQIVAGTESNFRDSTAKDGITEVLKPERTYRNIRTSGLSKTSVADITRNAPLFNDPRYTSSTLAIPTDNRTLNGLYRFFAETDPIVGAGLSIHSSLPLADLSLGTCEDTGVQQHYEEMWDRINGVKTLTDIVSEYHEIGDVVTFGAFNEADYMWDQFTVLNPDYVKIESTFINQKPLIKLIPDEVLKRIVQTQSPRFIYQQLPPEIIRNVLFNQEIPLEPNNTFHMAYAKRPYETRGRSLIKRILKVLMLEDRFMQAEFALATRHAVPLTIVKLGDATHGWVPGQDEMDAVREMMAAWELDPNFSIVYHWGIDVQFYGSNGKMLPVGPELDRMYRLKFIGMGIHEQLLTGQGGSYSQAYVNMEIQRQRYLNLQLKVEQMVHQGWFKSIADLCGFYKIKQARAGFGGTTNYRWGNIDEVKSEIKDAFVSLRDYQDNEEFKEFISKKAEEQIQQDQKQIREYVYPELDWGGMSAADDENLKNYVKWLVDKRPYLVDDATLARLAKLDRDKQEDAYIKDLRRAKDRYAQIAKEQLLPFMDKGKGGGGGDFGGGDIGLPPMPTGGSPDESMIGGPAEGGAPPAPIGQGGPPETAQAVSSLDEEEKRLLKVSTQDDLLMVNETTILQKNKAKQKLELLKVVRK